MNNIIYTEIPYQDPVDLFAPFANEPFALLFDSNASNHPKSRYSYILINPIKALKKNDKSIFDELNLSLKPTTEMHSHLPPFQGGWAGYFGYDLGFDLESSIQKSNTPTPYPKAVFGFYNNLISFDHIAKKAWIVTLGATESEHQTFRKKILNAPQPPEIKNTFDVVWQSNFERSEYENTVQKIIDYIHEGDIFQANMSQQFSAEIPTDFNYYEHYKNLRHISPAPFSAYLNFEDFTLSSSSPELFLSIQNGDVLTGPIKGTSHAYENPNDLKNSDKDQAENIMIVDLLRNDLAKNCTAESVEVPKLCALETFSHVHHLVSEVTGKLKDDKTCLDLLQGAFPGGSITGAPKMRAMEIIEELEPVARGPYCGSIALIGVDGYMQSSITIRTLIFNKLEQTVHFNVGGGIVADSNPSQEFEETIAKANGIFESFESTSNKKAVS